MPRNDERKRVRRLKRRGLVLVEATNIDHVRVKALGCWWRAVGDGDATRRRVALDPRGEELLPTDAERAEAEAERARAERVARQRAEAELARLRKRLERSSTTRSRRRR